MCRYTPLLDRLEARKKERERVKANLDACLRMETEVRLALKERKRGGSPLLGGLSARGEEGGEGCGGMDNAHWLLLCADHGCDACSYQGAAECGVARVGQVRLHGTSRRTRYTLRRDRYLHKSRWERGEGRWDIGKEVAATERRVAWRQTRTPI